MFDGIEYRGFSQESVEILAEQARVPVWSEFVGAGASDRHGHRCGSGLRLSIRASVPGVTRES
jgi:hypothetical protein